MTIFADHLTRPATPKLRLGFWLAIAAAIVAVLVFAKVRTPVEGWRHYRAVSSAQDDVDRQVTSSFLASGADFSAGKYDQLFGYFLHGFLSNADPGFARVNFPGLPSILGQRIDSIEAFTRTAPLFAAWVSSGRRTLVEDPVTNVQVDLVAIIRESLLTGTDPASPAYWGEVPSDGQLILEAAEVGRVLWLTRDRIWAGLSDRQKAQIIAWLEVADNAGVSFDNNWVLSELFLNETLRWLGGETVDKSSAYVRFKRNYVGGGLFRDGSNGEIDFYNVWGINYELIWLHTIAPDFDRDFVMASLERMSILTLHLISPKGLPIFGRSLCYRTAVPAAVIAGSRLNVVEKASAARALDAVWTYFVSHGALLQGSLTMGYFGTDPRLVDPYTGPGSCQAGLRSLVLAFMFGPGDAFWTGSAAPLPVEKFDFRLEIPQAGWIVSGDHATRDIQIELVHNADEEHSLQPYSVLNRAAEFVMHRPYRPSNHAIKYELHSYSALHPLNGTLGE